MGLAGCFYLPQPIFDANTKENLKRLVSWIGEMSLKALIIDGCGLPVVGFSQKMLEFCEEHLKEKVRVFFLIRTHAHQEGFDSSLWCWNRKTQYSGLDELIYSTVQILSGTGEEIYEITTGNVFERTGGDMGDRKILGGLRRGTAFRERNWENIVKAIEQEMENK